MALLTSCSKQPDPRQNAEERIYSLRNESQLIFTEYTFKVICGSKDESIFNLLGDKEVLYRLTVNVEAGIDPRKIRPDALKISDDSLAILTLPHCELFGYSAPESGIENLYERVTGISSDFSANERLKAKQIGERKAKKAFEKLDILTEAEANATDFFHSLLVQAGFNTRKCIVQFE